MKLTLRLPGFKTGSRAATVDDCAINTLAVVFIDNKGNYLSEATVDQSQITGSGATYEVTLPIASNAAAVQLVANYEASLGADATTVGMTGDPDSRADIVFFGSATLAELQTDNPSVTLTRSVARTELTSTAPGFTVEQVKFYGTPSSGLVGSTDLTAPCPTRRCNLLRRRRGDGRRRHAALPLRSCGRQMFPRDKRKIPRHGGMV